MEKHFLGTNLVFMDLSSPMSINQPRAGKKYININSVITVNTFYFFNLNCHYQVFLQHHVTWKNFSSSSKFCFVLPHFTHVTCCPKILWNFYRFVVITHILDTFLIYRITNRNTLQIKKKYM